MFASDGSSDGTDGRLAMDLRWTRSRSFCNGSVNFGGLGYGAERHRNY